jgi:tRNA A58 N-methylase Trm61
MEEFFKLIDPIPRPYPLEYGIKLYNEILKHQPKICYEFGSSWGFTTCAIAKALHDIDNEKIKFYSYDIDPKRVNKANTLLKSLNLDHICKVETKDIFSLKSFGSHFDFLYIDIHNNGSAIQRVLDRINYKNKLVYFEGGSNVRNQVCVERKVPTFKNLNYEVIFGENQKHSFSKLI